jgi:dihydropteroate synthase
LGFQSTKVLQADQRTKRGARSDMHPDRINKLEQLGFEWLVDRKRKRVITTLEKDGAEDLAL